MRIYRHRVIFTDSTKVLIHAFERLLSLSEIIILAQAEQIKKFNNMSLEVMLIQTLDAPFADSEVLDKLTTSVIDIDTNRLP